MSKMQNHTPPESNNNEQKLQITDENPLKHEYIDFKEHEVETTVIKNDECQEVEDAIDLKKNTSEVIDTNQDNSEMNCRIHSDNESKDIGKENTQLQEYKCNVLSVKDQNDVQIKTNHAIVEPVVGKKKFKATYGEKIIFKKVYNEDCEICKESYRHERNIFQNAYGKERNIFEEDYSKERNIFEEAYGKMRNIFEEDYSKERNIFEKAYGKERNIFQDVYGKKRNIFEEDCGKERNIFEEAYGKERNIFEEVYGEEKKIFEEAYGEMRNIFKRAYSDEKNYKVDSVENKNIFEEIFNDDHEEQRPKYDSHCLKNSVYDDQTKELTMRFPDLVLPIPGLNCITDLGVKLNYINRGCFCNAICKKLCESYNYNRYKAIFKEKMKHDHRYISPKLIITETNPILYGHFFCSKQSPTKNDTIKLFKPSTKFICDICQHSSRNKRDLMHHLRSHDDSRYFSCEVEGCEKFYKTRVGLVRHMESTHLIDD